VTEQERVNDYLSKLKELKDERPDGVMEECAKFTLPSRGPWAEDGNQKQEKRGREIFDSRPVSNLQILANGMVGYNAGPASPWFRLKLASEELNDIPFVRDWLEECERVLYIIFASTNFYDALTEFYLDMGSAGTATMLIEEDDRIGITFSTRHPQETYILEGTNQRVDSIYRPVWFTGRQALKRYEGKLKDQTELLFQSSTGLTQKYEFLHVVHPRDDRDFYSGLNIDMPFASVEMYPADESILVETGYEEFPGVVGRWRKNSNDTYGVSPAMDAMPDIKRANQMKKTMMDAVHLAVNPSRDVPKEMLKKYRMTPGALNVYKDPTRRSYVSDVRTQYPFGKDVLDGIHADIDEPFFTDLFKMLMRSEREMTAREVSEKQGERVTGLSGPLTRQNSEVLSPAVKRVFHISLKNRWLPPMPPALMESGVPIDVDFIGLLSMSQKQYYRANGLNRGISLIAGIADATQNLSVWDNVNTDELVRHAIDDEGFPQKSIEEMPIVEQKRKARAEEAAKQRAIEQAGQMADMVPKLGQAPEEGSVGEEISKKLSNALPGGGA